MTSLTFPSNQRQSASFFDKRGYPVSVTQAGSHGAQQIYRQSALQTTQKENTDLILYSLSRFTLTNTQLKSIIR